jgi:hypothetical protein
LKNDYAWLEYMLQGVLVEDLAVGLNPNDPSPGSFTSEIGRPGNNGI